MKLRTWLIARAIKNLHSNVLKLGKKIIMCVLYIKTDRHTDIRIHWIQVIIQITDTIILKHILRWRHQRPGCMTCLWHLHLSCLSTCLQPSSSTERKRSWAWSVSWAQSTTFCTTYLRTYPTIYWWVGNMTCRIIHWWVGHVTYRVI